MGLTVVGINFVNELLNEGKLPLSISRQSKRKANEPTKRTQMNEPNRTEREYTHTHTRWIGLRAYVYSS